jgi:ABC-type dipeptide/oligopeptide/nickel transport system permease component
LFGFVARRAAQAVVVLVCVAFAVFVLTRATGDPARLLLPLDASPEQIAAYRELWRLDRPLYEQFAVWLGHVLTGDFGTSFQAHRPVGELISQRMWSSLVLALFAIALAGVLGTAAGVMSAVLRGTAVDRALRGFAILGSGIPEFAVALMLQNVFGLRIPIFPISGNTQPLSIVLPAATLAWFISAGIMRLVRSGMLEALSSDYVLFARAKGVPEWKVIVRHALGNAFMTPLTFLGLYVGILIGSAVIVEYVFAWPGLGSLAFEAVLTRDFPTLQGVILVVTFAVVISSIIIDLVHAAADPRLRTLAR